MKKRKIKKGWCNGFKMSKKDCSKCGGIYFLGFVGAVIYYIQTSTSFWNGVLGILKALVWPVMLVYKLFAN